MNFHDTFHTFRKNDPGITEEIKVSRVKKGVRIYVVEEVERSHNRNELRAAVRSLRKKGKGWTKKK